MLVDALRAFASAPGQSARVFLSCGTQLFFCGSEVLKVGGPPPFARDPARIAALVSSVSAGGAPVVCVELRGRDERELVDAFGRAFESLEARERALGLVVDPLAHWSGSYEPRPRFDRPRSEAPRVLEPDLFGGAF